MRRIQAICEKRQQQFLEDWRDFFGERLADGRAIITPLVWYPPLLHASPEQRKNVVLGAYGVHWPDIDEELSVAGMLAGVKPEYRWLRQKTRSA